MLGTIARVLDNGGCGNHSPNFLESITIMLRIRVSHKLEQQEIEHPSGPLEFGRGPARNNVPRCVLKDLYVSKDHIRILELEDGQVRIENLSQRNSIRLNDDTILATGTSREVALPVHLLVGETTVDIERPQPESEERLLQAIASPLLRQTDARSHTTLMELGRSPSPETLAHWFETVIAVQRAAAGSQEFFQQTARAVVTLVGAGSLSRRGSDLGPRVQHDRIGARGARTADPVSRGPGHGQSYGKYARH